MYKEKNTQSEARLSLTRIAGIIEELNQFLNTLPKEEWLESPEDPFVWIG
jgi:flagellin-specific chaperone FliS